MVCFTYIGRFSNPPDVNLENCLYVSVCLDENHNIVAKWNEGTSVHLLFLCETCVESDEACYV